MKHQLTALLMAGTVMSGAAMAGTIEVSNGGSIQDAINKAGSGDTVLVQPGTYGAFKITKNGITVKSAVPGGAHVVASGSGQPAIAAYGQNNIAVLDFKVSSHKGDGMKIGGKPGAMAKNVRIEGNTIQTAWLDGIKMFQVSNSTVEANTIAMSGAGGTAKSAGNPNGDGGIDWVQVVNSEMVDNTITSRGWACAMVKGGSGNNDISGNNFKSCDVNGLDMAAKTTGKAGAANKSGMIAFDSTVSGNTIDGGRGCAVRLGDATRNIKLEGNKVAGKNCNDGAGNGAIASGASTSSGTAGAADGSTASGGSYDDGGEAKVILASSGNALSGSCAGSNAVSNAMAGAGAVASIWSGGKATAPLQVAQQMQLVAQRICQTESLMTQIKMLTGMDLRTADDVLSVLNQLDPILQQGSMAMSGDELLRDLSADYPTIFTGDTFGQMQEQEIIWNDRTRSALDRKSQIENTVIKSQQEALKRSANIEQAGRTSGGIRGAQLATNALLMEMTGALNNQLVAQVAHQRALAEVQYREEAKREAAKTMTKDFMSRLATCDDCKLSQPLLKR